MMILTSLYSVADGLFVSNMVGDIGLSAVNIMFPVAMLIAAVGFMLGTGGSAVVARTLGEGRPDMANRFFSMFVFAVILFGGVLSAAGAAFVEPIARLAGASDILMDSCVSYGRILFAGSLPFMLQTSLQPFFVVAERPNMGLILSIASGVTNFAGDWVLIQLLGLPGAAWATVARLLRRRHHPARILHHAPLPACTSPAQSCISVSFCRPGGQRRVRADEQHLLVPRRHSV